MVPNTWDSLILFCNFFLPTMHRKTTLPLPHSITAEPPLFQRTLGAHAVLIYELHLCVKIWGLRHTFYAETQQVLFPVLRGLRGKGRKNCGQKRVPGQRKAKQGKKHVRADKTQNATHKPRRQHLRATTTPQRRCVHNMLQRAAAAVRLLFLLDGHPPLRRCVFCVQTAHLPLR